MHTKKRWLVSVVSTGGKSTVKEQRIENKIILENTSKQNPIVSAVFDKFPGAKIEKIHNKQLETVLIKEQSVIAVNNDEWDPVEKE